MRTKVAAERVPKGMDREAFFNSPICEGGSRGMMEVVSGVDVSGDIKEGIERNS